MSAVFAPSTHADDSVSCKQTDEILTELRHLRTLLEGKVIAPPPRVANGLPSGAQNAENTTKVELANVPFLGQKDAPLTMVEFTDFQCPFCNRFFTSTFPELKKNYIDSGKVRYYSMDLPLDMHRNALQAAQGGRCAAEQGQFWAMHDRMQGNPSRLELIDLVAYAQDIGIDPDGFRQCVESGKYKDDIQRQARDATNRGAQGTPAFVIGKSTSTGVEGKLIVGAQPYDSFDKALKDLGQ
jgi:protein-disulfide isomerase